MKSGKKTIGSAFFLLFVFLIGFSVSGQIYTWGDISSSNSNYSVTSIIEGKLNQIYVLGSVSDKNHKNLQVGYSRLSLNGEVLFSTVFKNEANIYNINSFIQQPDGNLRISGTSISQSGVISPYINFINPENNTISNGLSIVSTPHYLGEAKPINKNEIILTKSVKGSTTGVFNMHAYRIQLLNKDFQKMSIKLESKFNEEPKSLSILPDTSFFLLGKRFTDQSMTKAKGVIYYISPDFKLKWEMEVLNSLGLTNQCMTSGKNGWLYYFYSSKDKNSGLSSSIAIIYDNEGNKLRQILIDSFCVNSVLNLKNGNVLVAGYRLMNNGVVKFEKAGYIIFDKTLKKIKSRTLGFADKPDCELPSLAISAKPSSSEFTSALILSNGKIVLGGSVNLPVNVQPDKIILSSRANKYLIAILNANGDL